MQTPVKNALVAQLMTLFRNDRESVHVSAKQSIKHAKSKPGGPPPPKLRQPKTHVRLSPHERSEHMPQSAGQLMQSSKPPIDSHRMFPQTEQTPQSILQLAQVSVPRQIPSPQLGHIPQSAGQVKHVSEAAASQVMSPHRGQAPQSGAHVMQSSPSPGRQKPSPHTLHTPQSAGQLPQDSRPMSHIPSPHRVHSPQSTAQVLQSSAPLHIPSPQLAHSPQSSGQVSQRSVG